MRCPAPFPPSSWSLTSVFTFTAKSAVIMWVVGRGDRVVPGILNVIGNLYHSSLMDLVGSLFAINWHSIGRAVPALRGIRIWHGSEESFSGIASFFPRIASALIFKRLESR